MKNLINPKNKIFHWGPIDGRPIYADYWRMGFFSFNKKFKPGWALFYLYFERDKFSCIAQEQTLYDNGEIIFRKFILNDKKFDIHYAEWEKMLEKIIAANSVITANGLKNLDDEELYRLYKKWNIIYGTEFWNIGSLPETANWGGEQMLGRELGKYIKEKIDFNYAFEKLSAPENFSFYQREELDLLKIKQIKKEKTRERELKKHQEKYFWLLNSYHHTQILGIDYFKKVLSGYSSKEVKEKYKEIKNSNKNILAEKNKIIKKFKLPEKILKISECLAFCIWWQDLRKAYIFQANHSIDIFLKEFSKRFKISFNDLHYYTVRELEMLALKKKTLSKDEIKSRKKNFLIVYNENKGEYLTGISAKKFIAPYFKNNTAVSDVSEIKGITTSRGKIVGIVRVIYSSKDMHKLKKGEILVTPMTSPDYIVGLRKAGAIITDHGGMTCHAAIVSRELKIPCIVGTRIATKVLKDGDMVEVDADRGVVKILK